MISIEYLRGSHRTTRLRRLQRLRSFGIGFPFWKQTALRTWVGPALISGTRELIEYPYIIVYEVHHGRGEVEVLAVVHGARDR